jgi:hypothetical protein
MVMKPQQYSNTEYCIGLPALVYQESPRESTVGSSTEGLVKKKTN